MESNPTEERLSFKVEIGDFRIENNNDGFLDITYKDKMVATLQKMSGSVGVFVEEVYSPPSLSDDVIKWFNVRNQQ